MSVKRTLSSTSSNGLAAKKSKSNFGPWNMGLKSYLQNTDTAEYSDDTVVIIKDKYPKAKYHFLVLPRESIPNLKSLNSDHVKLLQHMRSKGQEIADRCHRCKKEFPTMPKLKQHITDHIPD